jgi:thiamine-phosphate diphosphorylase
MRPRVVLVTDPSFGDDAIVRCSEAAAAALPFGAFCVQLRDKRRAVASLRLMAWRLRIATQKAGGLLVLNGDPRLARDVGADGVHLGGGAAAVAEARAILGRPGWISVAAHTDDDVRRATGEGADAVLVSPIFATRPLSPRGSGVSSASSLLEKSSASSLLEKRPRGLAALRSARAIAGARPAVFALGGVTLDRVRSCADAGAEGVAVLRALLTSHQPGILARAIHDVLAPRW